MILMLLSGLAYGQAGATPPATAPATAPGSPSALNLNDLDNAHKARAVLDQTIKALGGEAYLTYQNKSEAGRYYPLYHGRTNSLGIPYNYYVKYPDKDRFEVIHLRNVFLLYWQVGNVQVKDKSDIVLVHNGAKGYETTFKGTAPQDPIDLTAYLRRREHSIDWLFRKWMNDPTVAFFYDGMVIVDGKATDQVTLLNSKNDAVTLNSDQNTHLPLKTSYSWRDPEDKQKNTEEEIYDNYRLEQMIVTPHSITRYFNGEMSYQRFINTAKYNLPSARRDVRGQRRLRSQGSPQKAVRGRQIHGTFGLEPSDTPDKISLCVNGLEDFGLGLTTNCGFFATDGNWAWAVNL